MINNIQKAIIAERILDKYFLESPPIFQVNIYPFVDKSFNDGCSDTNVVDINNNKEYLTSAAKVKRDLITKLNNESEFDHSLMFKGQYIRPDEIEDETHLKVFRQYDWETIRSTRSIDTFVNLITYYWSLITSAHNDFANDMFSPCYKECIHGDTLYVWRFVSAEKLCKLYPDLSPDDRVKQYMKDKNYNLLFVIGIGAPLSDGKPHGTRCPDYDDYTTESTFMTDGNDHPIDEFYDDEITYENITGLNGDLYTLIDGDFLLELMSCGTRVNKESLLRQCEQASTNPTNYHKKIINNEYENTIGGGLGVERLVMFLLNIKDIRKLYYFSTH